MNEDKILKFLEGVDKGINLVLIGECIGISVTLFLMLWRVLV